ncbi:hypothetical protein [Thalassoglobus sp.]|uniref:hypothetical protein n=1 Tax=Thalassoglobus sp. TaxID=2795869 RepID=UPI003AA846FF
MITHNMRHITLDGLLPVAIAASPFLVRYTVRDGHMLEVAIAILAPMLAAILRAAIGVHQLDAVTNGKPNLSRQILFSMAIVMLLLVEVFVSTLQFAQNEPLSSWFLPAGLFLFYLILIQNALRPDETTQYV